MDTLSDPEHDEVLTLLELTVEDIERSKQWLWSVTYHTIVAQGGLLALHAAYTSNYQWTKWVFIILAVGITVVGSIYIQQAFASLEHFRKRAERCLQNFGQPFQDAFGPRAEKREIPSVPIIWGTALLVAILIWLGSGGSATP